MTLSKQQSSSTRTTTTSTTITPPLLLVTILLLLNLICISIAGGGAISSSHSSSEYVSLTTLDEYGKLPQLQNAKLASDLHGRLILAVLCCSDEEEEEEEETLTRNKKEEDNDDDDKYIMDSIVVCTLHRPHHYHHHQMKKMMGLIRNNDSRAAAQNLINILADDDYDSSSESSSDNENTTITAMVCSGVRADAKLLISLLQRYGIRLWYDYNTVLTADRAAAAAAEVLQTFLGYDRYDEVNDGIGPVIVDSDFEMPRPFGIRSLVLGVTPGRQAQMISIDPTGVYNTSSHLLAVALGNGHTEAQELLNKRHKQYMSEREAIEVCTGILKDLYYSNRGITTFSDEDDHHSVESEILCEVLSSKGGRRRLCFTSS